MFDSAIAKNLFGGEVFFLKDYSNYTFKPGAEGIFGIMFAAFNILALVAIFAALMVVMYNVYLLIRGSELEKVKKALTRALLGLLLFALTILALNIFTTTASGQNLGNICGLHSFFMERLDGKTGDCGSTNTTPISNAGTTECLQRCSAGGGTTDACLNSCASVNLMEDYIKQVSVCTNNCLKIGNPTAATNCNTECRRSCITNCTSQNQTGQYCASICQN